MNAQHWNTIHYNNHNMYGYSETLTTVKALHGNKTNKSHGSIEILGKRTLAVPRSTFPGSGNHAAHWLGDNVSDWPDLYWSIPGLLTMSICMKC